jgi:hypothetical protein
MEPVSGPEVTMLLCDAAQAVDGKLYVLGGGWSQLAAAVALSDDHRGLCLICKRGMTDRDRTRDLRSHNSREDVPVRPDVSVESADLQVKR